MDGFLFALGLIPAVMFALGMINVLEHYGALRAARKLLTPLLRPLLGIPGTTGLALIGSLQSTDVGASLTRNLADEGQISENEKDVFAMFQFSAGAMITNFFSSGAILFTLVAIDGTAAVPTSIGACIAVMFIMKIVGANMMRLIVRFQTKAPVTTPAEGEA
jgi:nucleoside recognition membrane protein YjiH